MYLRASGNHRVGAQLAAEVWDWWGGVRAAQEDAAPGEHLHAVGVVALEHRLHEVVGHDVLLLLRRADRAEDRAAQRPQRLLVRHDVGGWLLSGLSGGAGGHVARETGEARRDGAAGGHLRG